MSSTCVQFRANCSVVPHVPFSHFLRPVYVCGAQFHGVFLGTVRCHVRRLGEISLCSVQSFRRGNDVRQRSTRLQLYRWSHRYMPEINKLINRPISQCLIMVTYKVGTTAKSTKVLTTMGSLEKRKTEMMR